MADVKTAGHDLTNQETHEQALSVELVALLFLVEKAGGEAIIPFSAFARMSEFVLTIDADTNREVFTLSLAKKQ